jgi:hypothetical protein
MSGKIMREKIVKNPSGSFQKYVKELITIRDKADIDEWCENFRAGRYNESFSKIIEGFSKIIRENIDEIITGNFDVVLRK